MPPGLLHPSFLSGYNFRLRILYRPSFKDIEIVCQNASDCADPLGSTDTISPCAACLISGLNGDEVISVAVFRRAVLSYLRGYDTVEDW
jgi:hypothetical protein